MGQGAKPSNGFRLFLHPRTGSVRAGRKRTRSAYVSGSDAWKFSVPWFPIKPCISPRHPLPAAVFNVLLKLPLVRRACREISERNDCSGSRDGKTGRRHFWRPPVQEGVAFERRVRGSVITEHNVGPGQCRDWRTLAGGGKSLADCGLQPSGGAERLSRHRNCSPLVATAFRSCD